MSQLGYGSCPDLPVFLPPVNARCSDSSRRWSLFVCAAKTRIGRFPASENSISHTIRNRAQNNIHDYTSASTRLNQSEGGGDREGGASVGSSLGEGERCLEGAGVPEASISAELLLAHVLKIEKWELYLEPERVMSGAEHEQFWVLLKKRATRYPLQYLLGTVPFRNALIQVDERGLIPRPETELLLGVVLKRMGREREALHLLDIGTGSGNIAVGLALERSRWTFEATDISSRALGLAQTNAQKNGVEGRIHFIKADLWSGNKIYDSIISNPPYLTASEMSALQPEICFEPRSALDGGPDGLDYYRRIVAGAGKRLSANGMVFFEVGSAQAPAVSHLLEKAGFHSIGIVKDDSNIERIISAKVK